MAKKSIEKKLRPEEAAARTVIANYLGEIVEPHDNVPTAQARPDLRIEYAQRPHAVVEVVRDIEAKRLQQHVEIDRTQAKLEFAYLKHSWLAIVEPTARVDRLRVELGHVLDDAEHQGITEIHARNRPLGSAAFRLHELGIRRAWCVVDRLPGTVFLTSASSWWFGEPANSVVDWAERVLGRNPDVAAKLLASGYQDRHAYLIATIVGETQIWGTLRVREAGRMDHFRLPTRAPVLPVGVDSLWIEGGGRVIAWFPETSWVAVVAEPLS